MSSTAHQAIYRKWRPTVFDDIVGQEHITRTLKNQILNDKIGHAYLFCGTRGTGKTTCAKVFSRAVNCLNPHEGNPCNECEICRGILDGSILDVKEIDAASNNGVDNIREIREDVRYVSTRAKYTVYIIDEVHMLSPGAFNALLKTLEEPPERVIFILATTELHKVPQTILSRCQRFDFKRISPSDITLRMKEIAHGDGLNITDDAYRLLSQLADGSMRDALSILERVVSACGSEITADNITSVLGISERETVLQIIDAVSRGDVNSIMSLINSASSEGKDLRLLIDSIIETLRDLLLCKMSDKPEEILNCSAEEIVKIKALSEKVTFEKLTHAGAVLTKAQADTKWIKSPRIIYELALIQLAKPEYDDSPAALLDRMASLEKTVANGSAADVSSLTERIGLLEDKVKNGISAAPQTEQKPPEKKKKKTPVQLYRPIPEYELTADNPIVMTAKKWDAISLSMSNSAAYLKAALINRPITIDADGIIMLFKRAEGGSYNIAMMYKEKLQQTFKRASGTDFALKLAYEDEIPDDPIDIWGLKPSSSSSASAQNPPDVPAPSSDPIDALMKNFGEIVENADESEFVDYNFSKDNFSQSSFDDEDDEDDDREEFLDENEKRAENGDEE